MRALLAALFDWVEYGIAPPDECHGSLNSRSVRWWGADPQVIINNILAAELAIDQNYITSETARQLEEIERRRKVYLGDRTPVPLAGRTVIVVDDGFATGSTVRTALRAIGRAGAGKIVLAVPVAPEDALEELRKEVDEIICLSTPSPFLAVGAHYAEFGQLADADLISLLGSATSHGTGPAWLRQAPSPTEYSRRSRRCGAGRARHVLSRPRAWRFLPPLRRGLRPKPGERAPDGRSKAGREQRRPEDAEP
jgi:hypothetical protein